MCVSVLLYFTREIDDDAMHDDCIEMTGVIVRSLV